MHIDKIIEFLFSPDHAKHYNLDKSMLERYLDAYKQMDGVIPVSINTIYYTPQINSVVSILNSIHVQSAENGYDQRLVAKLRRSYRALPSILNFYNKQFYESELIAEIDPEKSIEAFELNELNEILPRSENAITNNPFGVYFVNVDDGRNERKTNTSSWSNSKEVETVSFTQVLMS